MKLGKMTDCEDYGNEWCLGFLAFKVGGEGSGRWRITVPGTIRTAVKIPQKEELPGV